MGVWLVNGGPTIITLQFVSALVRLTIEHHLIDVMYFPNGFSSQGLAADGGDERI